MWFPFKRGKIAVVELFGSIESGQQIVNYSKMLESLREDSKVKAVVILVDCPGGTATGSTGVHLAVTRLAAEKPTVAYVSGMAASGGYMVSCPATRIVAIPGAIIGSIGVISARMVAYDLLDWLGVGFDVTKSGRLKDMGAFYREATSEEKEKEQSMVDTFHSYFVELVAKDRKIDETKVRELATGEIYIAEKAKELGLIDEVGDFEAALDVASKLSKVSKKRIKYIAPRQGLLQRLIGGRIGFSTDHSLIPSRKVAVDYPYYYRNPPRYQ